jgi:hypothetical protein
MTVNKELERTEKNTAVAHFKISYNLPVGTDGAMIYI